MPHCSREALPEALAVAVLLVASRIARWLLRAIERWLNRWDKLADNNRSLAVLFAGVERAVVNIAWILVVVYASIDRQAGGAPRRTLIGDTYVKQVAAS